MGDVALLVVSAGDVGEAAWLMAACGGRAAGGGLALALGAMGAVDGSARRRRGAHDGGR